VTNSEFIVLHITVPDENTAASIAKDIVGQKLAACVNILGSIRSIYSWQDKIEDGKEVLMIIKTRRHLFEALSGRISGLHPYSVPEIIAMPIAEGSDKYLEWIREVTIKGSPA